MGRVTEDDTGSLWPPRIRRFLGRRFITAPRSSDWPCIRRPESIPYPLRGPLPVLVGQGLGVVTRQSRLVLQLVPVGTIFLNREAKGAGNAFQLAAA